MVRQVARHDARRATMVRGRGGFGPSQRLDSIVRGCVFCVRVRFRALFSYPAVLVVGSSRLGCQVRLTKELDGLDVFLTDAPHINVSNT